MILNSKERKRAEYMYNSGKQSTKLSKKGKREFGKIIHKACKENPLRIDYRYYLVFTLKDSDREFKKNMKKFKSKKKGKIK